MSKIKCQIEQTELEFDYGSVDGTSATCTKWGASTESFGPDDNSISRGLGLISYRSDRGIFVVSEKGRFLSGFVQRVSCWCTVGVQWVSAGVSLGFS